MQLNRSDAFGYNPQKLPINDISANNMPNGLLRVPHIDNSKNGLIIMLMITKRTFLQLI